MTQTNDTRSEKQEASPHRRQLTWWKRFLISVLIPPLSGVLELTWMLFRKEVRGDKKFRQIVDRGEPVVVAIWHESLLVFCWYIARLLGQGVKITVLISPSVDGEVGAKLIAWYGSEAVRGSGRRSGSAALRGLKRVIVQERRSPCLTLDGSKGPRRYCKHGAVTVARMAGVPIVPVACAAHKNWRLRSWDRHLIPKPFTKTLVLVGDPIEVARDLDNDAAEAARADLEKTMNRLTQQAEKLVESKPDAALLTPEEAEEES